MNKYKLSQYVKWDEPYEHLMKAKDTYKSEIDYYKARIRLFFHQYADECFNGVINTCEINLEHFNNPCIVKLGYQELPRQAIIDFCNEFNFYMPTVDFVEQKDYEYDVTWILKAYYTFRKKGGKNDL